jgi:predicted enzyme related to lactoylglutathione lyase
MPISDHNEDVNLTFGSVVIYVDDVSAVLDFYDRAFGLEARFYDATVGFAELGSDGAIALASHEAGEFMMPGAYPRPTSDRRSGVEIAFWTDDVPAAFERAVAAGANAITWPRAMPWGQTVAYVESVEGTIIGFVTPVEADPAASGIEPAA